jgi:hypothetical protein
VLVEETLEMTGLALFISALLGYIEAQYGSVAFRVGSPVAQTTSAPRKPVAVDPKVARVA